VEKMPALRHICPVCQRLSADGVTHAKCRKPLGLSGLTCLWPYEGVLRGAILALKYKFAREIAREFSVYIKDELQKHLVSLPKEGILLPVPLYWYRENFRGFNQSELLGKAIAQELGWEFNSGILVRRRLKKPQTLLNEAQRRKNIRGAFSLNPEASNVKSYKSIVLFDDVFTTGSTLKEACRVLKSKGAERVWGLTVAR